MIASACPHCSATNDYGDAFCKSCGMALPQLSVPRVVGKGDFATTNAGVSLQSAELRTQLRRSSGTLLAVAILQTMAAFFVFMVLSAVRDNAANPHGAQTTLIVMLTIGGLFWGLYFWSRRAPLAAAIVGLVVYVSFAMLDFVVYLIELQRNGGNPPPGQNPFSGIFIKVIIIFLFIRAINAGVTYRSLQRQQADSSIP